MKVRDLLAALYKLDGELEVLTGEMDGDELAVIGKVQSVSVEEHDGAEVCALVLAPQEDDEDAEDDDLDDDEEE